MNLKTRIITKHIMIVLWIILIFILSNEAAEDSSARSNAMLEAVRSLQLNYFEGLSTFLVRKSAHIFMFFVLGTLMYSIVKEYKFSAKKAILLSIIFSLSYAGCDEIHQLFVPGRSGELNDVLIDTTAASIGIFAYYFVNKIRSNRLVIKSAKNQEE